MLTILIYLLLLAAPSEPATVILGDCTPHEIAHGLHDCESNLDY